MREAGRRVCRPRRDRRLGRARLVHRHARRRFGGARLGAGAESPGDRRRRRWRRWPPRRAQRFGAAPVMSALDAGRDRDQAAVYDESGQCHVCSGRDRPWRRPRPSAQSIRRGTGRHGGGTIAASCRHAARHRSAAATADIAVYARARRRPRAARRKAEAALSARADAKPQAGFVLPRRGAR